MNFNWPLDLPNRLGFLLESGEWSDCSFILGNEPDVKIFNAHKLLLSVVSPVFRAMFTGDLAEKSPVKILDIKPEIFQSVLDFIYSDEIKANKIEEVCEVLHAADKYMIPKLIEKCEMKILQILNEHNACKVYEMTKCFDRLDLKKKCLQIINEQAWNVFRSPSWEDIQLSTLLMIVDCGLLNANYGYYLLDAVMRWGVAACERKNAPTDMINVRKVVEPALRKIRFLNFSKSQFVESMEKWNILTEDEYSAILKRIPK